MQLWDKSPVLRCAYHFKVKHLRKYFCALPIWGKYLANSLSCFSVRRVILEQCVFIFAHGQNVGSIVFFGRLWVPVSAGWYQNASYYEYFYYCWRLTNWPTIGRLSGWRFAYRLACCIPDTVHGCLTDRLTGLLSVRVQYLAGRLAACLLACLFACLHVCMADRLAAGLLTCDNLPDPSLTSRAHGSHGPNSPDDIFTGCSKAQKCPNDILKTFLGHFKCPKNVFKMSEGNRHTIAPVGCGHAKCQKNVWGRGCHPRKCLLNVKKMSKKCLWPKLARVEMSKKCPKNV